MILWKITLRKLQEVERLVDLMVCEIQKLKRKRNFLFVLGTAVLFPIPIAVLVIVNSYNMKNIFAMLVMLGDGFMLPLALIFFSMIILGEETENDTLKNMYLIPISARKIVLAKLITLVLFAVCYSTVSMIVAFGIGMLAGNISGIALDFGMNLLICCMMCFAVLPFVSFVMNRKSNYVIEGISGFLFVTINFVFIGTITPMPVVLAPFLPIASIYRLFLPEVAVVRTVYVDNIAMPINIFLISICITIIFSIVMIERAYRRKASRWHL